MTAGSSCATQPELKRRIARVVLTSARGGNVVEAHVRSSRDLARVAELLGRLDDGVAQLDEATRRVSVRVEAGDDGLRMALRSVRAAGIELEDIAMRQPNLDEVFLTLTAQSTDDDHDTVTALAA